MLGDNKTEDVTYKKRFKPSKQNSFNAIMFICFLWWAWVISGNAVSRVLLEHPSAAGCQRLTSKVTVESIFPVQRLKGNVKYARFGDSSLSLTALALKVKLTACSSLPQNFCSLWPWRHKERHQSNGKKHEGFWNLDKSCCTVLPGVFFFSSLLDLLLLSVNFHSNTADGQYWPRSPSLRQRCTYFLMTTTNSEHTATFQQKPHKPHSNTESF